MFFVKYQTRADVFNLMTFIYCMIITVLCTFRNKKNKVNPDDRQANPLNNPSHPMNNPSQPQQQVIGQNPSQPTGGQGSNPPPAQEEQNTDR